MHNKPHTEATKQKISEAGRRRGPTKWGHLPRLEIVERLLNTDATLESIAAEYGCSSSTIKVIYQAHTTKEQRKKGQSRKQAQKLKGFKQHPGFGENHSKLIAGEKNPFYGKKHSAEFKKAQSARKRGSKASYENRQKLSAIQQGISLDQWQGFKTDETELARKGVEYKTWRKAVFLRDDYTCRMCGKRGGRLHAHHIKPFSTEKDLRFDVRNGVTLCADPCHKKTIGHESEYEHLFENP